MCINHDLFINALPSYVHYLMPFAELLKLNHHFLHHFTYAAVSLPDGAHVSGVSGCLFLLSGVKQCELKLFRGSYIYWYFDD